MSNRPNRSRPAPARSRPAPGGQGRTLLIIGIGALAVVAIGVAIALAGGAGDDPALDGTPAVGPVFAEGPPLPAFSTTADDPALGRTPPRVEGTDPDGAPVTIQATGTPTVVAFLAHWCPHCQAEVPVLVDLMEQGDLEGVRMVGVLTGTKANQPNFPPVAWLEREGWAGEILLDDEEGTAAKMYGLSGFPFLVFLDGNGTVVARTSGELPAEDILSLVAQAR